MADDPHRAILDRMGALRSEMLERRKALNEEHFYPRQALIQADCGAIGHRRSRYSTNLLGEGTWYCGYCDAAIGGDDV